MKVIILLCLVAAVVAKPDGYGHAPSAPAYASAPKAPVVYHAAAPTMTTYTIHTYHSPAPKPVVSAPPNYVPVTQAPAYAPAYAAPAPSYAAPAPSY